MAAGLFIAGTHAGVGKTLVASGLAAALVRRGHTLAVMKPVQTGAPLAWGPEALEVPGCAAPLGPDEQQALERLAARAGPLPAAVLGRAGPESLRPADGQALMRAAGLDRAPLDLVAPYRYGVPLEPAVCARLSGEPIQLDHLVSCYQRLVESAQIALVEGCSGLLTPLTDQQLMLDLVQRLKLSVLLVSPSAYGTINACLLHAHLLRSRGIPFCGVVLNRLESEPRPEEAANPFQLEQFEGPIVRGVMPFIPAPQRDQPDYLAQRVEVHLDLDAILGCLGV